MPETHAPPARDDAAAPIGRRLLGAAVVGFAASLLPQLVHGVLASTPPGDTSDVTVVPDQPTPDETDGAPTTSQAVTTTTEPPRRPTDADVALLGFALIVELAIVAKYDAALTFGGLDDTTRSVVETIREAHQAYGQSASALLGQSAPNDTSIDLPGMPDADLGLGPQDAILTAAYDLEAVALATHLDLIGQVEGTDGARLMASIAAAEARHCTVLADLRGANDLDTLLLTEAAPLQAAKG